MRVLNDVQLLLEELPQDPLGSNAVALFKRGDPLLLSLQVS